MRDDTPEARSIRLHELLGHATLSQAELREFLDLARLGGSIPICTGWTGLGFPYWSTDDLRDWFRGPDCLQIRDSDGF